MSTHLEVIEQFIEEILKDQIDLFCVSIKIKPTNNIKVFLDGDNGITIEKCVQVNRKLYKLIEEQSVFENADFSLEVSSPGVDEPIKLIRQYEKNVERDFEILLNDEQILEGRLIEVLQNEILLETITGKGKKAIKVVNTIPLETIKKATVLISFKNKK